MSTAGTDRKRRSLHLKHLLEVGASKAGGMLRPKPQKKPKRHCQTRRAGPLTDRKNSKKIVYVLQAKENNNHQKGKKHRHQRIKGSPRC